MTESDTFSVVVATVPMMFCVFNQVVGMSFIMLALQVYELLFQERGFYVISTEKAR